MAGLQTILVPPRQEIRLTHNLPATVRGAHLLPGSIEAMSRHRLYACNTF